MPRNMSCALTAEHVIAEMKDVTRRLGWWFLKPGDVLNLVDRTMGFKRGERPVKYKTVGVVSTRPETLNSITQEECDREGFSDLTPAEFVAFFCAHNKCAPDVRVNRIEWRYIQS